MRGKLYFTIRQLLLSLICLVQFLPAQSVPAAAGGSSGNGIGWDVPFQKCWEFETSQMTAFPPQSDLQQQTIFQTLAEGTLTAIDAAGGKIIWRSQFGGEIISNTLFEDNKLYLVNKIVDEDQPQIIFRSVSAATGLTLWQKNLSLNDSNRIFVSATGNNSIVLVSENGQILFTDKTSGAEIFRRELQSSVTAAPVLFENKVFIGTSENKITAFPATGGESVFALNLPNYPTGNFFVSASAIVAGDRSGGVRSIRLTDRKPLWKARTGAQIVDITEVSGDFLISSNDGFVYLLASKTGDRIWKKRLPGRLIGKPLVYHNFVLLQTIDGAAALILDLNSGKPVNQILFGEDVFSANSALLVHRRVIIPTSKGLLAYSNSECTEK
ncbi:MAG: PQQ-like beta-propeller repeat protein [Acidobacteriota bacterium]|nr:PQQ-like beta-propeller repeat protein [Acidobacteriota bacterium]